MPQIGEMPFLFEVQIFLNTGNSVCKRDKALEFTESTFKLGLELHI